MTYTPTEWTTGDTITAAKLNNIEEGIAEAAQSGGGWDAIIRLTHEESSAADIPSALTPTIVEGTFAELAAKVQDGECPCILVEYYHPWGGSFAAPQAFITYFMPPQNFEITIAGYFPHYQTSQGPIRVIGRIWWYSSDVLEWID